MQASCLKKRPTSSWSSVLAITAAVCIGFGIGYGFVISSKAQAQLQSVEKAYDQLLIRNALRQSLEQNEQKEPQSVPIVGL
jgi:hypothetical protein